MQTQDQTTAQANLNRYMELRRADDALTVGDYVEARFTNCGDYHAFFGRIAKRTKNYFRVECLRDFRRNSAGILERDKGRVLHVATFASRIHSVNNCIARKLTDTEIVQVSQ